MTEGPRIRWAPPVPLHWVRRVYEADAAGVLDDEVLDELGWRIWDRLRDVLLVSSSRVRCPVCTTEFLVRAVFDQSADEAVDCPSGDWSVRPSAWKASWEHRDLNGRCPEFERFVDGWPTARTRRDQMLLVDAVVHALHVSAREDLPGNFAARNFLEGDRKKIVALLDSLAGVPADHVATDVRQRYDEARDRYHRPRPASPR